MIYLLILGALADDCSLLPDKEAQIPNPSLVKCYRQNTGACCVAAHDQTINEKYSELFPSPCLREYDTMENFFCFACEKTQGKYTNKTTKVLRLCEDYAKYVWGGDLNKPTSEYDNCGMYTFWRDNPMTVIPSEEWDNAYSFFEEVKPPYFEDYTIEIVSKSCFSAAAWLSVHIATFLLFMTA